jgi:hypothetical protein
LSEKFQLFEREDHRVRARGKNRKASANSVTYMFFAEEKIFDKFVIFTYRSVGSYG